MPRAGWAVALALTAGVAGARPVRVSRGPHGLEPPLKMVITVGGERRANCLFSTAELAERTPASARLRDSFRRGEAIWGRCYLPERLGANRAGELVDVVSIDGKAAWEQAYDRPVPADAGSRSVSYGELLRTPIARLPAGPHHLQVDGILRRGGRARLLYTGGLTLLP